MSELAPDALEVHLKAARKRTPDASIYAFHHEGELPSIDDLSVAGESWRVANAPSELAIREAMIEQRQDSEANQLLALVTPLRNEELATDVLMRLADRQVLNFDIWEMLRILFDASTVAAKVRQNEALGRALLDCARQANFTSSTGGGLTEETAWTAFRQAALGQERAVPDLAGWLEWAIASPTKARLLFEDHGELLEPFADYLQDDVGVGVRAFFATFEAARESGAARPELEALALGLAYDAGRQAWEDAPNNPEWLADFRAGLRFKCKPDGWGKPSREALASFGRAASRAHRSLVDSGADVAFGQLPETLDQHLRDAGEHTSELAGWSDASELGWKHRIRGIVDHLEALLDGSDEPTPLQAALDRLEEHGIAARRSSRVRTLRQAARLAFWLATHASTLLEPQDEEDSDTRGDLQQMAQAYIEDRSFVDSLRESLTETDPGAIAVGCVRKIIDRALEVSDTLNQDFAELLSERLRDGDGTHISGTLSMHRVFESAIEPIARNHKVLLVVLDGMSWAVARAILQEKHLQHWNAWVPGDDEAKKPLLATIPSVTTYSRTSLLTGKLQSGTQDDEKKTFGEALRDSGAIKHATHASLFHKAEVDQTGNRAMLGDEVKSALGDDKNRVVGVVVNAIDDRLGGADGVTFDWSLDTIPKLRALVEQAGDRVVVLASDHGHIWETRSEKVTDGEGERWRVADGELAEGEIEFTGPQVEALTREPSIYLPWSEKVLYKGKSRGYHGGASMQEIVTPLIALERDNLDLSDRGFTPLTTTAPAWWDFEYEPKTVSLEELGSSADDDRKQAQSQSQLDLLDGSDAEADLSWIPELLETETFEDQLQKFGQGMERDTIALVLANLASNDGRLSFADLSRILQKPQHRTQFTLRTISGVLSLDGFRPLKVEPQDQLASLDADLLQRQFELDR